MYNVKHGLVPESISNLSATGYSLSNNDFRTPRFNSVYYGKHIMHLSMLDRSGGEGGRA